MQGVLLDADSAKIEWQGEPKPADLGKDGKHLYGWLVEFRVNSRNRFGQYTGKQSHGVLIRDDRVIKGTGFGYGFPTAKSDLIMASPSQFRRSVRRDVEAGTPRQSGATTTPTNHPEK